MIANSIYCMLIVINNFAVIHRYSMPPGKCSKTGQGRCSNKAIGPRKKHKQPAVLSASITTNVTSLEDPNPDFAISKAASSDIIMDDVNVFDMSGIITEAVSDVVDREVEPSIVITEALSDVADREVESNFGITDAVSDISSSLVEEADELVS